MQARVRAFAKLNLSLEVLDKRPDGFHNIRTVFQTISVHDILTIQVRRSSKSRIELQSSVEIPGPNLITRAAEAVLEASGKTASLRFDLQKRIPMGGGLGGGSSDAAAVLLALPRMLNTSIPLERLIATAATLGSDVPFFLLGGTAVGLGRGTELYPVPDAHGSWGLLLTPGIHVSTGEAYRSLGRTGAYQPPAGISPGERVAIAIGGGKDWASAAVNDFEAAVFRMHPELGSVREKLKRLGAQPARMTGSGAAIFGLFRSKQARDAAGRQFTDATALPFSFVSRTRYYAVLNRSLNAA